MDKLHKITYNKHINCIEREELNEKQSIESDCLFDIVSIDDITNSNYGTCDRGEK